MTDKEEISEETILAAPDKSRTLLVLCSQKEKQLYSQNLSVYTGTDVVSKYNADDAINFLKSDEPIDLIVCTDKVGEENTILKIYYYIKSNKIPIPIILIGEDLKLKGEEEVEMIASKVWQDVIRASAKKLNVTAKRMILLETEMYYPIDIRLFTNLSSTPVEVYHLCEKENYTIIFEENQKIELSEIQKLMTEDKKYLFVQSLDRLVFVNFFSKIINEQISLAETPNDLVLATGAAFSYSQELISKSGLTESSVSMAGATIDSMIKVSEQTKGLSNLFEIINCNHESYCYKHAILIAIIGNQLISKLDWSSKEQKVKLCFMAFFHDITIAEERLCKIGSTKELEESDLTPKEKKKVIQHAYDVTELITSYPNVPFGVDAILLQHHGTQNGIGFSDNKLNPTISPMAIVFMIVEDFVTTLIESGESGFDRGATLKKLKSKYSTGQYKKISLELERLLCPDEGS